ncbi:hypothetical protein ACFSKS_18150 [Pseudocitrobacter faecalis]
MGGDLLHFQLAGHDVISLAIKFCKYLQNQSADFKTFFALSPIFLLSLRAFSQNPFVAPLRLSYVADITPFTTQGTA